MDVSLVNVKGQEDLERIKSFVEECAKGRAQMKRDGITIWGEVKNNGI